MKTIEALREDLKSAIGGGNTGDIETASANLEEARFREVVEAAKCVVATAFGNTDGLSESDQIEALRMSAAGLRDALDSLS
jgi:hypothetical protein